MIFSWLNKVLPRQPLPVRDGISPVTVQDMLRTQRQLLGGDEFV